MPELTPSNGHNVISRPSGYMPQLDTLRTFAVIQVLFSHWLEKDRLIRIFPFGETGVTLFFVLSGFLITQILLKSREISEIKNQHRLHSAKQFYIRRFLRIFPVYYVTLFILFIFNVPYLRENFIWYLCYASNILFFKTQSWGGSLSHLWTLAVEEQFYIVWPFVILFIPKKYLLKSIIGIILIGPLSRLILFSILETSGKANFINLLTPTCMDCFGLGALLAYFRIKNETAFEFKSLSSRAFILFNVILLFVFVFFTGKLSSKIPNYINLGIIYQVFSRLIISVISFYLVAKASIGFKGFLRPVFENKILIYLGKISYGLYLFHNFIPMFYKVQTLSQVNSYLKFFIQLILLIMLSSVSWFLLEKPINGLKKYFAYN
jgi:peptidoglycan/LPS O-acetylase OafA/YrhL